jgi:hypothetical protein
LDNSETNHNPAINQKQEDPAGVCNTGFTIMYANKTGFSSFLALHMANHREPHSVVTFPRLVYFTKVGTCCYLLQSGIYWYLLQSDNLPLVPCWPLDNLPLTVDTCAKSEYLQLSCVFAFSRAI